MHLKPVTGLTSHYLQNNILGIATACLLLTAAGASALNTTEKYIQTKLPAGVFLVATGTQTQATQTQIDVATKAAIANPPLNSSNKATITTPSFVSAGVKYAPTWAPDLAQAGLGQIQADFAVGKFNISTLQSYTGQIMNSTMKAALAGSTSAVIPAPGYAGTVNDSDGAASVTSLAVNAVKNADPNLTTKPNERTKTLLYYVVTNAVKTAAKYGGTNTSNPYNGAGGVVTGGISQVAGVGNASFNVVSANDLTSANFKVETVIVAATKAASNKFSEIALAVGYAFASTYRASVLTTPISATDFQTANAGNLGAAMALAKNFSATQRATIFNQISAGIAQAYAGITGPGAAGVNDFAYNNGTGSPVTDVQGL